MTRSERPLAQHGPRRVLRLLISIGAISTVLGVLVAGLALPLVGLVGYTLDSTTDAVEELPRSLTLESLPQRSEVVDANGDLVATFYDQNRVVVPLSGVSRQMVKAMVAIEDYRFYEHGPIDLTGTLRAFITNQTDDGAGIQGGSTITQQLVKQTLLYQARTDEERSAATAGTYARKFRELRYAAALEEDYSKDWILERYLNTAYFGGGAYGVEAAAQRFFDTSSRDLDITQAATLAGLVKNPAGYNPLVAPDAALARRNTVLNRMGELGAITSARADRLAARPLRVRPRAVANGCVNSTAPLFCQLTVGYLETDPALGRTRQDRIDLLQAGGITVHTTMDPQMQRAASAAVTSRVNPIDQAIGSLAMVEPGSGEVRAVAQSRPVGRDAGETFLNYAVNQRYGGSSGFQAGSTFKAFVLAAAIEQGVPLSTTYDSPPTLQISEAEFGDCDGEPYGYGTWELSNSTTSGVKDLYSGTRESVNTFYAQLTAETGICAPYRLAKAMGVDLTRPTGPGAERTPSFTLGSADASPLELAEAYATFAARGLHCDARPVTLIEDAEQNPLKTYPATCTQVLASTTADAVSDILRGIVEGGFASDQALPQPAAGKTGNSEGLAVWFVGYTPTLAAAAMIAGADTAGTPVSLNDTVVGGEYVAAATGSGLAAPLWGDAMKAVAPLLPDIDFVAPVQTTEPPSQPQPE